MNAIEKIRLDEPALWYVDDNILHHFLGSWGADIRVWNVEVVMQCQLITQLREVTEKLDTLIDNDKLD